MARRRGRPRKSGRRKPCGRLAADKERIAVAETAAKMPHRQGMGDAAADQRAGHELGRLVLRRWISPEQCRAGEKFGDIYREYRVVLDGPRNPVSDLLGGRRGPFECEPCPGGDCTCAKRQRAYLEACDAIRVFRRGVFEVTFQTCVEDRTCVTDNLGFLKSGLDALAIHFGIVPRKHVTRNWKYLPYQDDRRTSYRDA
jgi:hypothetical protein